MGAEESDFEGWAFPFPGVTLIEDFVTQEEEAEMVQLMDREPWRLSQSGRKKQVGCPELGRRGGAVTSLGPSAHRHSVPSSECAPGCAQPAWPAHRPERMPVSQASKADGLQLSLPSPSWPRPGDCQGGFLEACQVPSCPKFVYGLSQVFSGLQVPDLLFVRDHGRTESCSSPSRSLLPFLSSSSPCCHQNL